MARGRLDCAGGEGGGCGNTGAVIRGGLGGGIIGEAKTSPSSNASNPKVVLEAVSVRAAEGASHITVKRQAPSLTNPTIFPLRPMDFAFAVPDQTLIPFRSPSEFFRSVSKLDEELTFGTRRGEMTYIFARGL